MDSVAQKLRSIGLSITILSCIFYVVRGCSPGISLHAQTLEETALKEENADTSSVTETHGVSLDKRLERPGTLIQFRYPGYSDILEPAVIRAGNVRTSDDIITTSSLTLTGLIQRIYLDKDTYEQGEIAECRIHALLSLENASITFLYKTYKLYPAENDNNYVTVLAVPMNTDPGEYVMTVKYDEKGERKNIQLPFTVVEAYFSQTDTAELDIHILTEETYEMLKYEGNYFARAYGVDPGEVLYEGDFIWPCSGRITSTYGIPRKYNENLGKWSHKAIDIANVVGTKVYASNNGVIALAKKLDVHGHSIVIAHGGNIHSVYLHLDKMYVKKGEKVKKGQLIAKLGKTGLCTGPNCHFGLVVNRVHANPRFFIANKPEITKGMYVKPELPGD